MCPLIEGEEKLKLLNFQYNQITSIDNLMNLPNLIFLDLYNNKITVCKTIVKLSFSIMPQKICNLEYVPSLRVLMLGKNNISKIENLESLTRLDVLDLHSNAIENLGLLVYLSQI